MYNDMHCIKNFHQNTGFEKQIWRHSVMSQAVHTQ